MLYKSKILLSTILLLASCKSPEPTCKVEMGVLEQVTTEDINLSSDVSETDI